MRAMLAALASSAGLIGCTSMSGNGLYYEFRSLGFTSAEANCLVAELDQSLSGDEMERLLSDARFERNGAQRAAISGLMRDRDRRIREAIASASRACLQGRHS